MTDGTKRKLTLPTWHIPYLEKHRIMDLFREVVRELVILQPYDHVLFMKQILTNAWNASKVSRVVLLSSPRVNCVEVARQIALQLNQKVITEADILNVLEIKHRKNVKPHTLATVLNHLTRTDNAYHTGWILADCIKTSKEAKKMLECGVLPTHVLHLIPPFSPPLTELLYCNVTEEWPEYRRSIMEIREVFKNRLVEVFLGNSLLHDVVMKCVELINIREGHGGPINPRVVIIGPRGSGRKTQAKLLQSTLDLVFVDFEYLLCQAWILDTELGQKLRACKDDVCYRSDLLCEVVNKRILEPDCLERGWVMTGYPFTDIDFKYLDTLDTPPNKVIFLECDLNVCKDRLINRRINVHTGSCTNIVEQPNSIWYKHLNTHPKDRAAMIHAELTYFCEQYGPLRTYCGPTATVINGDQPKRWVYECIAATIIRGAPPVPPRSPYIDVSRKLEPTISKTGPNIVFASYVQSEKEQKDEIITTV